METTRPTTAITLDTLHPKSDETLPLKLRVISERKARYYAVSIEMRDGAIISSMTPDDLKEAKAEKPKKQFKEISLLFADKEKIANEILNDLKEGFTFDLFKDRWSGVKKIGDPGNVFIRYADTIKDLESNGQYGTASLYDLSEKSLKAFIKSSTGKDAAKLYFKEITVKWLQAYESFMLKDKVTPLSDGKVKIKPGLSRTTVGIYLRPLRALFNTATELNEIDRSIYPFSKKKYTIPKGNKVKKALTKAQLHLLRFAEGITPEQEKARDFWFFSYTCNGMNVKDICMLKNENITTESLNFFREKTKHTNENQSAVQVMLTDFAKSIIEKYRDVDTTTPKAFVFDMLKYTKPGPERRIKVQNFTKFINQHIKKLALAVGVTTDISTYYARHSFATLAIQGGASIEFVSEALAHSDIKTTRGYFAGFEDTTKKEILKGLMDF